MPKKVVEDKPKNFWVKQRERRKAERIPEPKGSPSEFGHSIVQQDDSDTDQKTESIWVGSSLAQMHERICGSSKFIRRLERRETSDCHAGAAAKIGTLDATFFDKILLDPSPFQKHNERFYIEIVTVLNKVGITLGVWQKEIVKKALVCRVSKARAEHTLCSNFLKEQMQLVCLTGMGAAFNKHVFGYAVAAGPHVFWPLVETLAQIMLKFPKEIDKSCFACVIEYAKRSPCRAFMRIPENAGACISAFLKPQLRKVWFRLSPIQTAAHSSNSHQSCTDTAGDLSGSTAASPGSMLVDEAQNAASVIQEVHHEDPAAYISVEEASSLTDASYTSWVQHNALAADIIAPEGPAAGISFDKAYLLRMSRNPSELESRLTEGTELETVRASMADANCNLRLPSGALIFACPDQYDAVKRAAAQHSLRPYNIVVTETIFPLLSEAIRAIPSRVDVRIRNAQTIAFLDPEHPNADASIIIERTFLNIPSHLRQPQSVVQSTTEVHGGINPRRR